MMEHVKIKDVRPKVQYIADGVQTEFSYPFAIFSSEDLEVYIDTDKMKGGYEISGMLNTEGGKVVFFSPPENGKKITLYRHLSVKRLSDFQEGGTLRANILNSELDYITAVLQQLDEKLDRSYKFGVTEICDIEKLTDDILKASEYAKQINTLIEEYQQQLDNEISHMRLVKADTDFSNTGMEDYVVEKWMSEDGLSWYRKYKTGWIEQGGSFDIKNGSLFVNFPLPFTATPLYVQPGRSVRTDATIPGYIVTIYARNVTLSSMYIQTDYSNTPNLSTYKWEAKGY